MTAALAGIFVGGKSSRMGGAPKGLLPAPDSNEPLVARLVRIARDCGLEPALVGDAGAYRGWVPDVRVLADARGIEGPLAGLAALLAAAQGRPAIALACDLPYLEAPLLTRLADDPSEADVLAPRASPTSPWEPLLARYSPARVGPVLNVALTEGVRSFQRLFERLEVRELALTRGEIAQLRDWDSPGDLR